MHDLTKILRHLLIVSSVATQAYSASKPAATKTVVSNPADAVTPSNDYVHKWLAFPAITGADFPSGEKKSIHAKEGTVLVAFFVASWCIPCQNMVEQLIQLEEQLKKVHTQFVYIFAHDTADDVEQFVKDHRLQSTIVIADHEVLKAFHNPKIPTAYVSDRRTWLSQRFMELDAKKLSELQTTIKKMTAF